MRTGAWNCQLGTSLASTRNMPQVAVSLGGSETLSHRQLWADNLPWDRSHLLSSSFEFCGMNDPRNRFCPMVSVQQTETSYLFMCESACPSKHVALAPKPFQSPRPKPLALPFQPSNVNTSSTEVKDKGTLETLTRAFGTLI